MSFMKPSPQFIIYLVGVILLGFFYEQVNSAIGNHWLFFGGLIAYLVALRVLGAAIAKSISVRGRE